MVEVKIRDRELAAAAEQGVDAFLQLVIDRTLEAIGGELTMENMQKMSSDQTTLVGFAILREEVMDGGFIQLIYNGYGPFYFRNPFDAAMRNWGVVDLCRLMRRVKKQYQRYHEEIERDMNDDEFMASYEQFPIFDDFDDDFVSNEEEWSEEVAHYVDSHLEQFITITE